MGSAERCEDANPFDVNGRGLGFGCAVRKFMVLAGISLSGYDATRGDKPAHTEQPKPRLVVVFDVSSKLFVGYVTLLDLLNKLHDPGEPCGEWW